MDLKEQYQLRAEKIAEAKYNKDFYDLSDDLQYKVYIQAEEDVMSDLICAAMNEYDEMVIMKQEVEA